MLRFLTSGESHGQGLVTILEGLPAGLPIDFDAITLELRRRQGGYGRGRRMAIESDRAEILSGVRRGQTTGAPVALLVRNKDWENWQNTMHVEPQAPAGVDRRQSRAGGAAAARVTPISPARSNTITTTSATSSNAPARERPRRAWPPARLPANCCAPIGCEITSHITGIGSVVVPARTADGVRRGAARSRPRRRSRCVDTAIEQQMMAAIDAAKEAGDTLGGSFEVIARNVPVGLGSYVQWDRKLDGRLAQAADVDSGDQGGLDRRRRRRRAPPGLAGARRDRRRSARRAPASR